MYNHIICYISGLLPCATNNANLFVHSLCYYYNLIEIWYDAIFQISWPRYNISSIFGQKYVISRLFLYSDNLVCMGLRFVAFFSLLMKKILLLHQLLNWYLDKRLNNRMHQMLCPCGIQYICFHYVYQTFNSYSSF